MATPHKPVAMLVQLAALAGLLLAALPAAPVNGQAAAVAGAGNAFAGAGFPFNFPFNPFGLTPFPFCTAGATINPWTPPATIVNPPAGLLSSINGVPVFSDITLCCGSNLNFVWTSNGNHGVWQLASGACPATFVNNATLGQRQLFPVDPAVTSATLMLNTPGTFWFTSQAAADCANGQIVKVVVPAGTTCSPAGATAASTSGGGQLQVSNGPGSQASALGSPGGTSTSANNGSAASASGAPGQQITTTGPGFSYSSSGGRRLRSS